MAVMTGRVRAPELEGAGGWINTDRPLLLADLRGRAVLLDFWTFCCINCLRVIEELRPLEDRFGARLVVIGVHSPKFPHEGDHAAVTRAVRRHRIDHPVLDDPDMRTWQRYGVRAWPTLVLIDPDGYVVAQGAGEGSAATLEPLIAGVLEGRPLPDAPAFQLPRTTDAGFLAYPGKVASDGAARLAVSDTGHDRVLVCDLNGAVLQVFDGFQQPQGVRFDGERLVVCDTVGGRLVSVALEDGARSVLVAGLRSPWDSVVLPDGSHLVAEAGLHRLVGVPRGGGDVTVVAGTRAEGLRDGPASQAHLAQPSGLALLPDGAVAIADSEVSALRVLRNGRVETLVGSGLFDWGDGDGGSLMARLQHPLGVAALPGGAIAVADTFNSLLRVWRDGELRTVHLDTTLDEPGGIDVLPDGRVVLADTGNHRVLLVDIAAGQARELPLQSSPGHADTLEGAAGELLSLPAGVDLAGRPLDRSQGPPVRVTVTADPPSLLAAGPRAWAFDDVPQSISCELGRPGEGEVTIDTIAATCHEDVCEISRNTVVRPLRVRAAIGSSV